MRSIEEYTIRGANDRRITDIALVREAFREGNLIRSLRTCVELKPASTTATANTIEDDYMEAQLHPNLPSETITWKSWQMVQNGDHKLSTHFYQVCEQIQRAFEVGGPSVKQMPIMVVVSLRFYLLIAERPAQKFQIPDVLTKALESDIVEQDETTVKLAHKLIADLNTMHLRFKLYYYHSPLIRDDANSQDGSLFTFTSEFWRALLRAGMPNMQEEFQPSWVLREASKPDAHPDLLFLVSFPSFGS